ncbi:uncharacterized protein LOC123470163 isoform X2 [Daphnia magna]|uniref:uncharacterized protein LOC123470163 isoform X2 n=1 Tax=Daphnia magna TaxID=35525 RepID=UPI001E1BCE8C|nr:uncharacterized protein LOC123470163 isoform X2 [Daphnia magna]
MRALISDSCSARCPIVPFNKVACSWRRCTISRPFLSNDSGLEFTASKSFVVVVPKGELRSWPPPSINPRLHRVPSPLRARSNSQNYRLQRSALALISAKSSVLDQSSHLNDQFHLICSCPNILSEHRSKVLQLVDLYGVAVNEHGVSQPVTVIPTHQLPTVTSSLPPQSLRTASTSFDLLVEYIEPVTPKTVISHFDKQAHIPIFCEQHREALIPYMVMEYTKIRHHFEAKRLNNLLLSKQKAKVKAKFKEGKLA